MLGTALTYCCCNTASSLCTACCGQTGAGTTGRKRSVLLLTIVTVLSLWMRYDVGPTIVNGGDGIVGDLIKWTPGLSSRLQTAWVQSYCADHYPEATAQCAGAVGVWRVTAVSTLFFLGAAVAARVQPDLNRQAWPAKLGAFFLTLLVACFCTNSIFAGFYLPMARLGATVFLVLQQVILIDMAYNWNEAWVERADIQDRVSYGSGIVWLRLLVATSVVMYAAVLAAIVVLYQVFCPAGCPGNTWIVTLTLLCVVALTVVQLSGTEGSLLTSAVLSLYAVYLASSMVSKHPLGQCNPYLSDETDVWGTVVGLLLTAVSLAWTGWSWTAEERLGSVQAVTSTQPVAHAATPQRVEQEGAVNLDVPFLNDDDGAASGLVVDPTSQDIYTHLEGSHLWKLNIVMALISCYIAMILTGWGSLNVMDEDHTNAANPTAGRVNMTMIGVSQFCAVGLYVWTLLAPRLFPDRDFS